MSESESESHLFSRRQVELILRRTAELEQRRDDPADVVAPEDLEKVAEELGISQDALRQAMSEARAGLLRPAEERGLVDRFFGTRNLEARRFVPGDDRTVGIRIDRLLEEDGFIIKRRRGVATVWEPSPDLWVRIRRALHGGPHRLPREVEIETRVLAIPGGPHPVLVHLRADASRLRGSHVTGAAVGLGAGVVFGVVGAAFFPMPVELITWAVGGATGVVAGSVSRSGYRSSRAELETALERLLDRLERVA